jgi:dihydroorotate dehydrogenase
VPVFLKLAPDLEPTALADAVHVAMGAGCIGVIATNTTITRPGTTGRLNEGGGMSGAPLWPLARARVEQVVEAMGGRGPVVGVGGINSPDRAEEMLNLGCDAIQVYSGLIFEGPGLPLRILRHLAHQPQRRLEGS